jgi:phosphatidylglycerol---prolipoprotein diacylglyceryl transferase
MFPYLYQSNSFSIGSYGVMLALAYLIGRYYYIDRLNQVIPKPINSELLIISLLVFGVIGAKLMFVLKNPERASLTDWSSLTAGSGFSSQGAILAAILVTIIFARLNKLPLATLLDAAAPPAVLAYAIARVGCFLAGDDCYGVPSDLPWTMAFPHGFEPTEVRVHPLPLYEAAYSIAIWYWLTLRQRQVFKPCSQFFLLLSTWGVCRFLVEFISTNPPKVLFMSGSQFGALLMLVSGIGFFTYQTLISRQKKAG